MVIKGGGGSGATATPKTFGTINAGAYSSHQAAPEDDDVGAQMAIQTCDAGMSPLVEKFNASAQAMQASRQSRQ